MTDNHSLEALPEGVTADVAAELAAALDKLFAGTAEDEARYLRTRHMMWQAIATMMDKGIDDGAALQTVLSAVTELLTRAAGPSGAGQHLRLMANRVAALDRQLPSSGQPRG